MASNIQKNNFLFNNEETCKLATEKYKMSFLRPTNNQEHILF